MSRDDIFVRGKRNGGDGQKELLVVSPVNEGSDGALSHVFNSLVSLKS